MEHDSDLKSLATKYGTDKWGSHYYAQHYEAHFSKYRNKKIKLLEIGVGGYADPNKGGESLRMWKEYFQQGLIYAVDIFDKSGLVEERIDISQGSQTDNSFLQGIVDQVGKFDIIIDDGSHINKHITSTFDFLFKHLKDGGLYVVEDLQTSYWKNDGGDSFDLGSRKTAMNYFKRLTDSLNYEEIDNPWYKVSYFDRHIVGMHFYHNMVFIEKGLNNEGSNIIVNNIRPTRHKKKAKLSYFYRKLISTLLLKSR